MPQSSDAQIARRYKEVKVDLRAVEDWIKIDANKYEFVLDEKLIRILNRTEFQLELSQLNLKAIGMIFAELTKRGPVLSLDACQLFAKKTVKIDDKQAENWMKGFEVLVNHKDGFVIISNNNDILGSGYVKNKRLKNTLPKWRLV